VSTGSRRYYVPHFGAPGEFHHPGLGLGLGLRFRVTVRVRVRVRDRDRVRDRGGEILRERPAFYSPANYPLPRTFLPQFVSRFLPVSTPASRTSALSLFTNTHRRCDHEFVIKASVKHLFITVYLYAYRSLQKPLAFLIRNHTFQQSIPM